MKAMRFARVLLRCSILLAASLPVAAQSPKDYISAVEADKIRDAETPDQRIKLFLTFGADRIKKIEYELGRPEPSGRRDELLNGLINSYTGCIDDAADLIDLAVEKQQDIRAGIKEMQTRGPEFLAYLKGLAAQGKAAEPYQDNLEDSIDATVDAMKSADEASTEIAPPPVRRRP
jgi:hypothetical protein